MLGAYILALPRVLGICYLLNIVTFAVRSSRYIWSTRIKFQKLMFSLRSDRLHRYVHIMMAIADNELH